MIVTLVLLAFAAFTLAVQRLGRRQEPQLVAGVAEAQLLVVRRRELPHRRLHHVRDAATRAGERCWPLPLHEDYFDQLKSEIADMLNSGGRPGGAITAAMFLKEFTGGRPWAHIDIAGTAWAEEARPYQPKGATGIAVRTLTELAFSAFPV